MTRQTALVKQTQEISKYLNSEAVVARFEALMGTQTPRFLASVMGVVSSNKKLAACDPHTIYISAMKAAEANLSVDPNLGLSYLIPYGKTCTYQLGYKGIIELAQRTQRYTKLNGMAVREGHQVRANPLTGDLEITGHPTGEIVGFASYFQLTNGFSHAMYWTREQVEAHAKQYSKTYGKADSPWTTAFEKMGIKTLLKQNIGTYGPKVPWLEKVLAHDDNGVVDENIIEAEVIEHPPITPDEVTGELDLSPEDLFWQTAKGRGVSESEAEGYLAMCDGDYVTALDQMLKALG